MTNEIEVAHINGEAMKHGKMHKLASFGDSENLFWVNCPDCPKTTYRDSEVA